VIKAVGGPCGGMQGSIPVPTDWPEQQVRVDDEEISPFIPRITYRDVGGVRQMVFTVPQLPAGEIAQALVTFEVTRSSILPPEDTSKFVIPKNPPREVAVHLAASPLIETRHPSIRDKIKEIVPAGQPAWQQVEAIYDWLRDNVKYGQGADKGAAAALRDGHGNKHDLTSLFIALCRAHDVPARTVWVVDHCYAEFYLQDQDRNGGWFPCQVAGTRDFGRMADFRPILQKGDNIKVPEDKAPRRFVTEFLTGKGGRGGRGQPQVEFVRKLLPAN
jgi:transglutaminase-like putative cysteine protease